MIDFRKDYRSLILNIMENFDWMQSLTWGEFILFWILILIVSLALIALISLLIFTFFEVAIFGTIAYVIAWLFEVMIFILIYWILYRLIWQCLIKEFIVNIIGRKIIQGWIIPNIQKFWAWIKTYAPWLKGIEDNALWDGIKYISNSIYILIVAGIGFLGKSFFDDSESKLTKLNCPTSLTIVDSITLTVTHRDYPLGNDGKTIEQEAIKEVQQEVEIKLNEKLRAKASQYVCNNNCSKKINTTIQINKNINVVKESGWFWDSYDATATATGSVIITCSPE